MAPLNAPPAIRIRRAVVLLGRFPALAGADLDVSTGEVVHLAGPNGAGKTTLLRVCAGLASVATGEVEVLGVDLRRNRHAIRRRVGLLGHSTGLYDDLTVEENVGFAARASGRRSANIEVALEQTGLVGRLRSTRAAQLSAGQRRRVALAALVSKGAELWLLDEPHAGLDARSRDVLDGVVLAAARAGATILIASHDADRVAKLADRSVVIEGGQSIAGDKDSAGVPQDAIEAAHAQ